jgi:hypothetical protein
MILNDVRRRDYPAFGQPFRINEEKDIAQQHPLIELGRARLSVVPYVVQMLSALAAEAEVG